MATLTNKRALVLGGSRGIGAAIVERLTSEGAATTFTYNRSAESAMDLASRTNAKTLQADSADRVAMSQVIADQGALDILVINAGMLVIISAAFRLLGFLALLRQTYQSGQICSTRQRNQAKI